LELRVSQHALADRVPQVAASFERFVFEINSRILAGRVARNSPTVALPNGLPKLGRNSIRIAAQNSIRKILVFLHADEIIQQMNTQSPRASF
jgi:hypothetical protein